MATFDTWESYFYPETINPLTGSGTLRNLAEIRDPEMLRKYEYTATASRQRQLVTDPSLVSRTYDADHLQAIHGYLFQDVYKWAGQYRSVDMMKGRSQFAEVAGGIDRYLEDVHNLVESTPWQELDHDQFATQSATVFAYLNQGHPFREGNGRTSKVFMNHVAEQSPYKLDFSQVTPDIWNQASMLSGPDLGKYEPMPDPLIPVFRAVSVQRPQTQVSESQSEGLGQNIKMDRNMDQQHGRSEVQQSVADRLSFLRGNNGSRLEAIRAQRREQASQQPSRDETEGLHRPQPIKEQDNSKYRGY